jgi:hypothetical protein
MRGIGKKALSWADGLGATTLWRSLPTWLEEDTEDRLSISLKYPAFDDDEKERLKNSVTQGLSRYFPGIEDKIKTIFSEANH